MRPCTEVIFSETHGAVAQFAAIAEFIFQTFQRFMTWPLMVRFHYGHPDVWDKGFTMTNGGVSKAGGALRTSTRPTLNLRLLLRACV